MEIDKPKAPQPQPQTLPSNSSNTDIKEEAAIETEPILVTSTATVQPSVAITITAAQPAIVTAASSGQNQTASLPQYHIAPSGLPPGGGSKYNQLLALIEELGKDIRPTYTGNRNCTERLKRAIGHARILTRECIQENEKGARQ